MRLFRKLTKKEWKEIGEKYKDGGVHNYRGKKTLFWNGEKLSDGSDKEFLIYDWEERQTWEVIIILPGVEVIPEDTFSDCENVKTVIMADSVRRIEDMAFRGCESLSCVRLSSNLEYIGESAFEYCQSLTSIFIPPSCREIGNKAFNGCTMLIILIVPQQTHLGQNVIADTSLIMNSPFETDFNANYENTEEVNDWIIIRLNDLPLHRLCCSEDPTFDQNTIIPTREKCCIQDDCGFTPLIYLISNKTAEYDTIEQMVKIGGQDITFIEDKDGWNVLHWACALRDEAVMKLLVKIGGRQLVDTLESERLDDNDRERFRGFKTQSNIESALLLHDYINAIQTSKNEINIDEMLDTILKSEPSYRDVTEIMSIQGIPYEHHQKLQEYNTALLEKELETFTESQEKVPFMRSTITVVGRGRDGKTSTINSLKGLPFQRHCESTKGAETSEVKVHEVGIHVTNVNASGVSFEEAERDPHSTKRSVAKRLMDTSRDFYFEPISNTCESKAKGDDGSPPNKPRKLPSAEVAKCEEQDVAEKKGDFELDSKGGKSIRFTIYDNGGQRVFRSIQNLLLSREGIFVVVFNMMNLITDDKSKQSEALEHLHYWLSSIKLDACKDDSIDSTDLSIRFPPVILVGTHYDEFRKDNEEETLKQIDNLLMEKLAIKDLIYVPDGSVDNLQDRQNLYNGTQGLCFWPVDNSDEKDTNVQQLRELLLDAAMNDQGYDISREVPISFLKAMDKLTELSEDVPIVPISSSDPEEDSVMSIMKECGVFEEQSYTEGEEEHAICKGILKQYQNIGHLIYFHQAGLEDYCIIDPQWLINMITYVVRDFKLHRFRRDFKAMTLNDGKSWESLLNCGILDGALLRKLWLDREHESFLIKLMVQLGIFGELHSDANDPSRNIYTVPLSVTLPSEASQELSMSSIRNHLSAQDEDDIVMEKIDLSSFAFNLVPFYSCLVNQLVSEWSAGYDCKENLPVLLPCAANLCLNKDFKFSIILNEEDSTLEAVLAVSQEKKKMNTILKNISDACDAVNINVYRKRLHISMKVEKTEDSLYRDSSMKREKVATPNNVDLKPSCNQKLEALISLGIKERLAETILEIEEDITPEELICYYNEDKDEFENEILPDLGIIKKLDKRRIMNILKEQPEPLKKEKYALVNVLDDDDLELQDEKAAIERELRSSYFSSTVCKDAFFVDMLCELTKCQAYKIVHFGMHGSRIDKFVSSNLATCFRDSSIQCVFLNTCNSKDVADHLLDNASAEKIIFWKSKVKDVAARAFSEALYNYLCMNRRQNCVKFKDAFDYAKKCTRMRKYVFLDPVDDLEELEKERRKMARPDLEAAGIPVFYENEKKDDEQDPYTPEIIHPNDCKVMISFNNATAGEDAEKLCHFLNREKKQTFCTRVFCPNNMGDWREYTETGANKCKVFIALMTDEWQKSGECQIETKIIKNRLARKRVVVIPVYYKCFDEDYDEDNNHFYRTSWASYQGIPCKEEDGIWMESISKLLAHMGKDK
ncbi:hypothetical protein CTEN210_18129 [Chaetoceros tenuissimus]|uniref:TIR domain-containing protein n=1 Tax=Chaetoceros tenuissimus TaxID=426638 RepID=A0AAD3HG05_9STRA|nr:hypothetical protein CTEN210_18129 [Chaetoceros tenuissimus]